jgi:gliding motility-associated-like protein
VGFYPIQLEVTDGNGNSNNQVFEIEVLNVNDLPNFTSVPVTEATNNVQYTYLVTTNDIDIGDLVNLTVSTKPSWLNFTSSGFPQGNGRLQGTPQNSNRGQDQQVKLQAIDQNGGVSFQEFTINVDFPNTAPTFTSSPITGAIQDEPYSYEVTAEDADNDVVIIRAIVVPNWLNFSSTSMNTTLSGTPQNAEVGEHIVVLEAEDFLGLRTTQNFTITVENVNDAPEITSEPVTSAIQNIVYEYQIVVQDIDVDDEVSISIVEKPDWLNFDGTSLLSGTPSAAEVDNSPFYVEILVTDIAGATDFQSFEIRVTTQNQPPTLDIIGDQGPIFEDDLKEFQIPLSGITTGGESNQNISIEISTNRPDLFEYLEVDYTSPETTGLIRYKILPDSFGIASIILRIEDNGPVDINFFETSFQIEVLPVNDIPEFISEPITRIQPGENYRYEIITRDGDPDDQLTIEKTLGPAWLVLTDNGDGTGTLEGLIPILATNEDVTIEVTDSENKTVSQHFSLKINTAPRTSDISVAMQEDIPFELSGAGLEAAFTDDDGDEISALQFTWTRGTIETNGQTVEQGETIDFRDLPNVQYIPPANFFGPITLQWAAADNFVFSEFATITVEIEAVNDPPILTSIEATTIEYVQGASPTVITNTITVTDVDDENLNGASVQILENYNSDEDRLSIELANNSTLTQNFDNSTGILVIQGIASKAEYENALRTINYQNINPLTTDTDPKNISFIVNDSSLASEPVIRQLKVTSILPELDIINAFTPDGNGVNDTWDFINLDSFDEINIRVYNNDGLEVYRCQTFDCEWDGKYKGSPLPAGTYFYLIKLNNGRRKYEGDVTILR